MNCFGQMLSSFLSILCQRKAFVEVNPRYESFLKDQGLTAPEDFLALPAIIVSGHPDRHVTRVALGAPPNPIKGFLKKEHRVPIRDRLANALAGFGFCSKSYREAMILRTLKHAGVGGPEFVAAGEGGQGQAFLLVREVEGARDIRHFLGDPDRSSSQRRGFANELGKTLARTHDAGFHHRDLYSKHILVRPAAEVTPPAQPGFKISLLDWQRSRSQTHVCWAKRWQDLAALDATLAENLANARERLACLHAYLSTTLGLPIPRPFFLRAVQAIRRQTLKLLRQRKIREMRLAPLAESSQQLLWLKGEELCVTREFYEATDGRISEFFHALVPKQSLGTRESQEIIFPRVGPAILTFGRTSQPFQRLWSWIRRRRLSSSELEKAAIIFRLERHGVGVPLLLAFGQRPVAWGMESFLLTKIENGTIDFTPWLSNHFRPGRVADIKQSWTLLREAGKLFRQMHDAHCYFSGKRQIPLRIQSVPDGSPKLLLGSLDGFFKRHRPSRALALSNLRTFLRTLASVNANRSDCLRFILGYLGQERLRPRTENRSWSVEHRWKSLAISIYHPRSSILDLAWRLAG
jgi:hypothetical protein